MLKHVRLFLVTAAILALAVTYLIPTANQLGVETAQAQAPTTMRYIGIWAGGPVVFSGTDLYEAWGLGWISYQSQVPALPVAPSQVLCVQGDANGGLLVTVTGELYVTHSFSPWSSLGVIPGGTVTVQPETWTGVKEKYRK